MLIKDVKPFFEQRLGKKNARRIYQEIIIVLLTPPLPGEERQQQQEKIFSLNDPVTNEFLNAIEARLKINPIE